MSVIRRFGVALAGAVVALATAGFLSQAIASAQDDPALPDDNVLDVVDSVLAGDGGALPTTPTQVPPIP